MKKGIMKTKGWYIIKTITWIWYGIAYPFPHPLWLIFMNELVLFIFFMKQFFSERFNRVFQVVEIKNLSEWNIAYKNYVPNKINPFWLCEIA